MITPTDKLDLLDICLRILDGLTKAFENLDKLFDELVASGESSQQDSQRYIKHCELLENLHAIVVQDLTALRNDLVCDCADDDHLDRHAKHTSLPMSKRNH